MGEKVAKGVKGVVPLQEGLFTKDSDGKYHLLGNRCKSCKLTFFPERKYCGKCGSSDMEELILSDRGKVFTFSRIDRKSSFVIFEPPYMQAEVELPGGAHVFTVLDKCDLDAVKIGMEVEVYVEKVKEDENGNDVITYKFKPAAA